MLVGLAALEAAWLGWYLAEPLPNAANVGGRVVRWAILARFIPGFIPGLRFDRTYLGEAIREIGHVENLPQRLPIVLAAVGIAAAAVATGRLILRGLGLRSRLARAERIPVAFGLGASGLGVAALIAGRSGAIGPWPVRIGLGMIVAAEAACLARDRLRRVDESDPKRSEGETRPSPLARIGFAIVVGPFLLLMALGAMLPTLEFDATEYHLQGPKEYYQSGRIAPLPHNVYTSMPSGVEMLHLLGMEVLDDWWRGALVGQLLVACFAPATAALIALTARRGASPRAGWIAAVVYLTTPWVYRVGVIPFVEGPLCFYHAALIWTAWRACAAESDLRVRLWGVVGLLAGGAMACKYPALVSAAIPFGLLATAEAIRRRSWRVVPAFAIGWGVIMGPWLVKNVIDTGNPVYPLAYSTFGGREWDDARDAQWRAVHGPRPITAKSLIAGILDVAGRSDWQSPLYVALAPLAFCRPGPRRLTSVLGGYAAYIFLTWWLLTHRLDRFWLPLLPPMAVLAGIGADWARDRRWSLLLGVVLAVSIVANLAFISTDLASGINEWTGDLRSLREKVPRMINAPLARLDSALPPGSKVLLVGQAGVFHLDHPVVYNTVFNRETIETLARGRTPEQVGAALAALGVTHVYVDWSEIDRYRSPGNYGFTPFVTPELFAGLVAAGVLDGPEALGPKHELFRVRGPGLGGRSGPGLR